MKKLFAVATLGVLFAVGFTLTGCAEETEIEPAEPVEVEPAPMPEPEPMPMPADTMMMEGDTTMDGQM
jgi:hypothetical protein